MANKEHLDLLKQGTATWNLWREKNPAQGARASLFSAANGSPAVRGIAETLPYAMIDPGMRG